MASQKDKTDERVALEQEALGLGVEKRGMHFRSDEQLAQAIIEKKAEVVQEPTQESKVEVVETIKADKSSRKKAPSMDVSGTSGDDREEMIARLEKEDPECKYVFQNSNVTARQLSAKGLERTEFSVRNDVVCRTTRDSFESWQQSKIDSQYEDMQAIDGGTGQIEALTETAKKPKGTIT